MPLPSRASARPVRTVLAATLGVLATAALAAPDASAAAASAAMPVATQAAPAAAAPSAAGAAARLPGALRPAPGAAGDPASALGRGQDRARVSNERFLVRYQDPAQAGEKARAAGRKLGLSVRAERRLATGVTLVRSTQALDASTSRRLRDALAADPGVRSVQPDRLLAPSITPGDPAYPAQWHYQVLAKEPAGLNLPPAWDLARGAGVTVAVIDTGSTSHTDLNINLVPGYDFISDPEVAQDGDARDPDASDEGDYVPADDPYCGDGTLHPSSWHGTHVSGTIAAAWNNGVAGVGVAHFAKVQPVRVLGRCGGYVSDIIDAIVWASGGSVPGVRDNPTPAKVINMSLGGYGDCGFEQDAVDTAVARGTTVVVAAGNSNADARGFTPASCANVVTVAALDRAGNRAYYSNYGPAVDVAAPGGETNQRVYDGVLSTLNAGTTTPTGQTSNYYMGTSMAAPHVAGVVALVQTKRRLTPAQAETALKNNARPVPGACTLGCGAGLVDAYRTVYNTQRFYPAP